MTAAYPEVMSEATGRGLSEVVGEYPFAYVMTVTGDGRPHAVALQPVVLGGTLQLSGLGEGTRGNIAERPQVSLVWPPGDFDGYSLIVNGRATVRDDTRVIVVPTRAVLHRPHDHEGHREGDTGCGSDCVAIDLPPTERHP